MSDDSEYEFFQLRKASKTYISKVFTFNSQNPERVRQVRMVIDGNDSVLLGEIDGAMCLRLLVIGSRGEFAASQNNRETMIKWDTFELFRQECRSIDILTFDELLERTRIITRSN